LEAAIAAKEAAFGEGEITRPPHWSGYRLIPDVIEFWVNRPYRLHDRLVFSRVGENWDTAQLYP
ncbi:MAG: pyridoxine 5'-phosphate oxidase C-terminal domain-containing protein, partial [Pseudomonadota bacterium]